MRRIITASTVVAIVASLAALGCDRRPDHSRSMLLSQLQYEGGAPGVPNPMPGTPIADAGIAPIVPAPTTPPGSPTTPPGAPTTPPGSPTTPPGQPINPGTPGNPNPPGSPPPSPTHP